MFAPSHLRAVGAGILLAGCGSQPVQRTVPSTTTIAPVATATSEATCVDGKQGACGAGQTWVAGTCRAARSIAATSDGACVVTSGKVACWGDNSDNVFAPGSKGPRATPVGIVDVFCVRDGSGRDLPILSDIADIAIGSDVLFAVRKSGEVAGVRIQGMDVQPAEVPKITDAVSISAGHFHACVVQKHGDFTCWGEPSQTGSGDDVRRFDDAARRELAKQPIHPKGLKDVVQLSVGDTHTCVVLATRRLMC